MKVKQKVHQILMKIMRFCKGSYCFKQNSEKILKSLNLDSAIQMIEKDTALFIQKILETNLPKRAKTIYREPRSIRNIKYFLKDPSHSGIMDKNVFVRGIKVYNSMDEETRT